MSEERKLITIGAARELLGVSKPTMARLLREGRFSIYDNPRDRRSRLLDANEVARGPQPRLLVPPEGQASKTAA